MIKRVFDLTLLALVAPLLLPLAGVISLLVWIKLGRPLLFAQPRGGLNCSRFDIYKFRSMTDKRDANGVLLPDEKRLTPFGKFLRASSLDELPCLYNVLIGEMSLVGPRPFIADYLDLYTPEQLRRHDAIPGITGWAQINGRNSLTWEEKFDLDLWYVDHRSFWLDLKILFLTVQKVFSAKNIGHSGEVTMPRFTGTKP